MGRKSPRRKLIPPSSTCGALAALLVIYCFCAPASVAGSLSLLSQNMNRLFDDVDNGLDEPVLSPERFASRIERAAARIAIEFQLPQIIALQEVENLHVLTRIALRLRELHGAVYRPILLPGHDPSGINIAYLVIDSVEIRGSGQLFGELTVSPRGNPLFSRPPLYLEACYLDNCLTLLNLHLRSMRGIAGKDGDRIRHKRLRQAEVIAAWCQRFQQENPGHRLVVLGDLNALTPADDHVDVAGILRGAPDNRLTLLAGRDLLEPDLVDLTRSLPPAQRASYRFRGRMQQLDYLLVNTVFTEIPTAIRFSDIDTSVSDHAGLWARFDW